MLGLGPDRRGRRPRLGLHHAGTAELVRPAGRRDRGLAVVGRQEQRTVASRRLLMLHLHERRWRVGLVTERGFPRGRLNHDTARAAVIAAAMFRSGVVAAGSVVFVRHVDAAEIVIGAVVVVRMILPVAAAVAAAAVSVSVVDAAVVADLGAPVAGVPEVAARAEDPISGCPDQVVRRGLHPGGGHPVIAVRRIGPESGGPEVAGGGHGGWS